MIIFKGLIFPNEKWKKKDRKGKSQPFVVIKMRPGGESNPRPNDSKTAVLLLTSQLILHLGIVKRADIIVDWLPQRHDLLQLLRSKTIRSMVYLSIYQRGLQISSLSNFLIISQTVPSSFSFSFFPLSLPLLFHLSSVFIY